MGKVVVADLILGDEVYQIVGAALEVYWQLGRGFLEPVYQEAMEIELTKRLIPFASQKRLTIQYKGQPLTKEYIADLIVEGVVLVELKAIQSLDTIHSAQCINYLAATKLPLCLLINFGKRVDVKRIAGPELRSS